MPLEALKSRNPKGQKAQNDNITPPDEAPEYDFFKTKRDSEGNIKDVQILQTGFLQLLRRLGFRRYDVGDSFEIVRIVDNVIERIPVHRLREIVVRYFNSLPEDMEQCNRDMLIEKLHRSLGTLTTDEKLALLVDLDHEDNPIQLVEDTKDAGYYFYRNGFVEVTADGARLYPYKKLPGYIWKDQILPRDFSPLKLSEFKKGIYYRFACNIAGNKPDANGNDSDLSRFVSFTSITGYNLHRYFNTKLRSTIFLDSRMTDDPDGRSGKSLHCKAMAMMMNADSQRGRQAITIDGKRYDPQNRFNLDEVDITTRLVVFDDIKKGFNIEDFFNAIVDGLVRERKGDVNKVRILAKLIFTLNYTIQIRGGSAKDRVIEFEIADHYSSAYTPEMEFGQWFFRDWDAAEWNRYDNFMLWCVAEYLRGGLIKPDTINLEARKLRDETCQEFINFMEDLQIEHEKQYSKRDLYVKFADIDSDGKIRAKDFHWLKQRNFTTWLRLWATYRPEMAGYREYRSNGIDYIRYFYNTPVTPEFLVLDGAKGVNVVLFPEKSGKVGSAVAAEKLPF
jgi:hypothetical protein